MPIDIDAEILAREGALDVANNLAHAKAREEYLTAFRRTYNAKVAESRDMDTALHAAGEIAQHAYCNVHCVAFLNALHNEVVKELAKIQREVARQDRS